MSYPNPHNSNVQISVEYVTWYMDMYVLKSASGGCLMENLKEALIQFQNPHCPPLVMSFNSFISHGLGREATVSCCRQLSKSGEAWVLRAHTWESWPVCYMQSSRGLCGHVPLKNQFSEGVFLGVLETKFHCCDSMPAVLPYTDRTFFLMTMTCSAGMYMNGNTKCQLKLPSPSKER